MCSIVHTNEVLAACGLHGSIPHPKAPLTASQQATWQNMEEILAKYTPQQLQ